MHLEDLPAVLHLKGNCAQTKQLLKLHLFSWGCNA